MTYERCMKYKCKVCEKNIECMQEYKADHLMWKPFVDLPKYIKEKGIKIYDNPTR